MTTTDWLIIGAIWLTASVLVGVYAQARGADGIYFGLGALFLSPLIVGFYVAVMDPHNNAAKDPQPTAGFCSQCGKPRLAGATFCPSCGHGYAT